MMKEILTAEVSRRKSGPIAGLYARKRAGRGFSSQLKTIKSSVLKLGRKQEILKKHAYAMTKKKISGISRIDSGATHGWFVRAYRNGKTHSKFFSDLKNKGKGKALNLAVAYRDELRKKLGPPASRAYRVMKYNSGNTSGVIGVSKTKRTSPNGTKRVYYTVSWRPEPNLAKNKSFSVHTMGDKKAFDLACKFRRKMEREIKEKGKKFLGKAAK